MRVLPLCELDKLPDLLLCCGTTNLCVQTVTIPIDTLKLRMQISTGPSTSAVSMLRGMIATDGVLSLWRGLVSSAFCLTCCTAPGSHSMLSRATLAYRFRDISANLFLVVFALGCMRQSETKSQRLYTQRRQGVMMLLRRAQLPYERCQGRFRAL